MEIATFGSSAYRKAQEKLLKHLEVALEELDGAEQTLKILDDPNIQLDQTKLRMMDTRGRIASTLVYLKKKWRS